MTVATLSPALADLADAIQAEVGTAPPRIPAASPAPSQSRDEWLAEVEAARAEGDRLAAIVIDRLGLPVPEVSSIRDTQIPVDGGNLASRVYVPHGEGPFPAVVYFHGGAWWLAGGPRGFALNDSHCRILCAGAATVVVNVDYRLAPEFPYPVQLEDAFAAVRWTQMSGASSRSTLETSRFAARAPEETSPRLSACLRDNEAGRRSRGNCFTSPRST